MPILENNGVEKIVLQMSQKENLWDYI